MQEKQKSSEDAWKSYQPSDKGINGLSNATRENQERFKPIGTNDDFRNLDDYLIPYDDPHYVEEEERRFKECVAIEEYEQDIWLQTEDNMSNIHQEIFRKKDEGIMEQENQQLIDKALVPIDDQVKIADVAQIYMQQFWYTIHKNKITHTYQFQLDNQQFEVGAELFCEVLQITLKVHNQEFVEPPPHDDLVYFVKQLGYNDAYLESQQSRIQILWGMIYKRNVDYAELIWEDFQFQIDSIQTSAKRREQMPYPRFTKGEEHQKYEISIPDSMMNDEIRNSAQYMTYLALSTNTKVSVPKLGKSEGKGLMGKKKDAVKKKDVVPRKKRSIIVADNILPDPDDAVKLAESISLTEAEHQDEERRLYETHASHVIGREAKEKLKGIETLSIVAKLLSDVKTATRASKKDYKIQQHPKGSSEGSDVIPEAPNDPRDISDKSDWGLMMKKLKCYLLMMKEHKLMKRKLNIWKRLMRADEIYKFSDGMLKSVRDNMNVMLHNFVLGYNKGMPKRAWTEKDQKRTDAMVRKINNMLLERRIMRSLESFVGGKKATALGGREAAAPAATLRNTELSRTARILAPTDVRLVYSIHVQPETEDLPRDHSNMDRVEFLKYDICKAK
ncbi:hypothetical protein Tco_0573385 [Tanacetum coccineum]